MGHQENLNNISKFVVVHPEFISSCAQTHNREFTRGPRQVRKLYTFEFFCVCRAQAYTTHILQLVPSILASSSRRGGGLKSIYLCVPQKFTPMDRSCVCEISHVYFGGQGGCIICPLREVAMGLAVRMFYLQVYQSPRGERRSQTRQAPQHDSHNEIKSVLISLQCERSFF